MKKQQKSIVRILKLISDDLGFNRSYWDANKRQKWEQPVKPRGRGRDPFKSLIGTILSARNRDESTRMAADSLFSKYSTPQQLADAPLKSIEKLIKRSGFYKTKARYVKETSRMIVDKFDGKVPDNMDDLCSLPGVGRKVAGCVLVYSFGKTEGVPTDTHVHRVSNRIGLVNTKNPNKTEQVLMKIVPKKYWIIINELFVSFGKKTCKPIGPLHDQCPVRKYCDFYKNMKSNS
jgi:endonuclease-3